MIKGYELYEMIAKGKIQKNTKFIDARNKVWKFDGAEFIKEIGDSDIYSDLEFARMDFEIIEDEEEIDIQSIEEIKEVFIENSSCGEDVKFLARKYNLILQAVKQLDKNMKELNK